MKKYLKIVSLLTLLFIVFTLLFVGCRPAERPNLPNEEQPGEVDRGNDGDIDDDGDTDLDNDMNNDMDEDLDRDMDRNMNRDINRDMNDDLSMRAENIADSLVDIPGIDDATVVISENTALVGVQYVNGRNNGFTATMNERVEDTVRRVDRRINNVVVTADPNLFEQIDDIATGINRGRPMTGFTQEIQDILRRIQPTR
ncbi:YhcN/YlaJ family sporulation lipoprotein [Thermohalobacter berrensis]|uniref:Sporulation protein n=1 Tax=Thermohalobacter berrensis TaxID=99594 RepID=A0A419T9Z8_9FIRM|nr:YhcN/YlaJ family sporulation lipoprotein [Thermohalobacter berrensis]RKD34288.1 hypothetical protein BET03_00190 [Thermohalobacter berrensis]